MKPKLWKQLDVDFGAKVVVDEDNHYVSTACSATAAKLFIKSHNAVIKGKEEKHELLQMEQR